MTTKQIKVISFFFFCLSIFLKRAMKLWQLFYLEARRRRKWRRVGIELCADSLRRCRWLENSSEFSSESQSGRLGLSIYFAKRPIPKICPKRSMCHSCHSPCPSCHKTFWTKEGYSSVTVTFSLSSTEKGHQWKKMNWKALAIRAIQGVCTPTASFDLNLLTPFKTGASTETAFTRHSSSWDLLIIMLVTSLSSLLFLFFLLFWLTAFFLFFCVSFFFFFRHLLATRSLWGCRRCCWWVGAGLERPQCDQLSSLTILLEIQRTCSILVCAFSPPPPLRGSSFLRLSLLFLRVFCLL